jgi:3-dehydroquinate dehydratase/shikimate dehydrogenase
MKSVKMVFEMNTNKIAVSLAPRDTEAGLATLRELAPAISMAEIRLDLMASFDLRRLIAEAPCRLIITCRPPREGGRFSGSEAERLAILRQAMDLGCAYVDSEWDSVAALAGRGRGATKLIVSRHWNDQMPATLWPTYLELRDEADVVKLVGLARRPADMLPVFDLLNRASSPVIGLAMGEAGRLTRLLAPCFPQCLLTYAAPTAEAITAPGQLSVQEMTSIYHIQHLTPETAIHLHLCATEAAAAAIRERNAAAMPGERVHVPLVVSPEEAAELVPGLRASLPQLTITADPPLNRAC